MKIAIVTFEHAMTIKTSRGITTTVEYLRENLSSVDIANQYDIIVIGGGKKEFNYPKHVKISRQIRYLNDSEGLRFIHDNYDFVIYQTPGLSIEKLEDSKVGQYDYMLDMIHLPFTFIYHSEEYDQHQKYRQEFVQHPDCQFLTFIADFSEIYKSDLSYVNNRYTILQMLPKIESLEHITSLAKNKKDNTVISTSAWTTFKRISEYYLYANKLQELGLSVYSAGAHASTFNVLDIAEHIREITFSEDTNWYVDADHTLDLLGSNVVFMKKLGKPNLYKLYKEDQLSNKSLFYSCVTYTMDNDGKIVDYDAFYPEDLPRLLSDKAFHWDVSYYRTNSKAYIPRLQVVSIEALNNGCLPIVCTETSPEWLEDSAIRISKDNYDEIKEYIPMTQEARVDRIINLTNQINNHLMSAYKEFYKMYS